MCVCHPWSHRDAFAFAFGFTAGGARDHASLAPTKTLALVCEIDLGRQIDVPAEKTYVELKLSTSLFPSVKGYCSGDEFGFSARTSSPGRPLARCLSFGVAGHLKPLGPPLDGPPPPFLGFLTCTLRNWNPRPACGTAIKSVRISMSVFGFALTRDEPAECLPWTR